MSYSNKRRKSEHGNAMIEFSLGFMLLWTMFAGVYQVGYAYYTYNALMTCVSNAAIYGARIGYDTASPSSYTSIVQNMVLYGDETAGTRPIVRNLTASNVNVSVTLDGQGIPRDLTVSITGYSINALFTTYALTNKPRATSLYYGQVGCSTC
jgi:Flp pilus assembly protein TadG